MKNKNNLKKSDRNILYRRGIVLVIIALFVGMSVLAVTANIRINIHNIERR